MFHVFVWLIFSFNYFLFLFIRSDFCFSSSWISQIENLSIFSVTISILLYSIAQHVLKFILKGHSSPFSYIMLYRDENEPIVKISKKIITMETKREINLVLALQKQSNFSPLSLCKRPQCYYEIYDIVRQKDIRKKERTNNQNITQETPIHMEASWFWIFSLPASISQQFPVHMTAFLINCPVA